MSLFDVAAAADIRPRSSCSIEQLPVISAAATVSCSSLYTRPKSAAVSPHSRAAVGCVVSCYCDQLWKVAVWRAGQMSATISTSCSRKLCDYPADLPSTGIPAKLFVLKNCKSSPPPPPLPPALVAGTSLVVSRRDGFLTVLFLLLAEGWHEQKLFYFRPCCIPHTTVLYPVLSAVTLCWLRDQTFKQPPPPKKKN